MEWAGLLLSLWCPELGWWGLLSPDPGVQQIQSSGREEVPCQGCSCQQQDGWPGSETKLCPTLSKSKSSIHFSASFQTGIEPSLHPLRLSCWRGPFCSPCSTLLAVGTRVMVISALTIQNHSLHHPASFCAAYLHLLVTQRFQHPQGMYCRNMHCCVPILSGL